MNKLFSRRSSKSESHAEASKDAATSTNFFSLPAELRNTIYALAAKNVSLTIVRRWPGSSNPIPGLLLASRRCRMEVLPILLSNCALTVKVIDFNFLNVLRVIGGLYSRELKALRMNKDLTIILDGSERSTERGLRTNLRSVLFAPNGSMTWAHQLLGPGSSTRLRTSINCPGGIEPKHVILNACELANVHMSNSLRF